MKKIVKGCFVLLTILGVITPLTGLATEKVQQEWDLLSNEHLSNTIRELEFKEFWGFEGMIDWFTRAEYYFDTRSNQLVFRDSVGLVNPGHHTFHDISLWGHLEAGKTFYLGGGYSYSGGMGYIVGFDIVIPDYEKYEHFSINVSYSDNLWNQHRTAGAAFTIEPDLPNIDYDRQYVNFGTALNNSSVLSMSQMNNTIEGDNLGLWTRDGNIRQTFRLINVPEKGENVYQIFNHSQHTLLAWNKTTNNSSQVFMHRNENKSEHYWILEKQRDGTYVIANYADNNMVLDVTDSNTSNGTSIQIYPRNGTAAQRWMINSVEFPIL